MERGYNTTNWDQFTTDLILIMYINYNQVKFQYTYHWKNTIQNVIQKYSYEFDAGFENNNLRRKNVRPKKTFLLFQAWFDESMKLSQLLITWCWCGWRWNLLINIVHTFSTSGHMWTVVDAVLTHALAAATVKPPIGRGTHALENFKFFLYFCFKIISTWNLMETR